MTKGSRNHKMTKISQKPKNDRNTLHNLKMTKIPSKPKK